MSPISDVHHFTESESVPVGQVIFEQGQLGNRMYVVKEGEVELLVNGKLLTVVERGGIVGEMALIDNKPRSATAIARTDCTLLPLDEHQFTALVQHNPTFALQVMRVLVHRLREMNQHV